MGISKQLPGQITYLRCAGPLPHLGGQRKVEHLGGVRDVRGMAGPNPNPNLSPNPLTLQTDYVDLYMLHGAAKDADELRATWRALEAAARLGKIRWLGVSNFDTQSLQALLGFATVAPAVVQNKMDVYHQVGGGVVYLHMPLGESTLCYVLSRGFGAVG